MGNYFVSICLVFAQSAFEIDNTSTSRANFLANTSGMKEKYTRDVVWNVYFEEAERKRVHNALRLLVGGDNGNAVWTQWCEESMFLTGFADFIHCLLCERALTPYSFRNQWTNRSTVDTCSKSCHCQSPNALCPRKKKEEFRRIFFLCFVLLCIRGLVKKYFFFQSEQWIKPIMFASKIFPLHCSRFLSPFFQHCFATAKNTH